MKHLIFAIALTLGIIGSQSAAAARPAGFTSTDTTLENTYRWARDMALSYVHDGADPVGIWYEAALPGRDAFCMRDLSHQTVGAAILGLDEHNLNMLRKVAANISENKDWCSYWEIDRLDSPAPCDYANDKEFWYNLPANPDVVRACYGVYEWTGNPVYLTDSVFTDFYRHSVRDYADRWALTPDSIMSRRRFMNTPQPFDRKNGFHTCRGLPSYAENFSGITVAIDLLGALRTGARAYGEICRLNGDMTEADFAFGRADAYAAILDSIWWDDANNRYNTYYTQDGEFHRGEGIPYLLLIGAIDRPERISASVSDVLSRPWNVENMSAFPVFLYRNDFTEAADSIINTLPDVKRNDYPEVSYGVIEGIFCGLMGIRPSASAMTVETCYHGNDGDVSSASDVPMLGGTVSVTHNGRRSTTFTNRTPHRINWQATFIAPDGTRTTRTTALNPGKTKTLKR